MKRYEKYNPLKYFKHKQKEKGMRVEELNLLRKIEKYKQEENDMRVKELNLLRKIEKMQAGRKDMRIEELNLLRKLAESIEKIEDSVEHRPGFGSAVKITQALRY